MRTDCPAARVLLRSYLREKHGHRVPHDRQLEQPQRAREQIGTPRIHTRSVSSEHFDVHPRCLGLLHKTGVPASGSVAGRVNFLRLQLSPRLLAPGLSQRSGICRSRAEQLELPVSSCQQTQALQ